MTIEIKEPVTKEKLQEALDKLKADKSKKNIKDHFGKLKRGLDGITYQNEMRNDWV